MLSVRSLQFNEVCIVPGLTAYQQQKITLRSLRYQTAVNTQSRYLFACIVLTEIPAALLLELRLRSIIGKLNAVCGMCKRITAHSC